MSGKRNKKKPAKYKYQIWVGEYTCGVWRATNDVATKIAIEDNEELFLTFRASSWKAAKRKEKRYMNNPNSQLHKDMARIKCPSDKD